MTATGTGGSTNPTTPATTYAVNFVLGSGGLSMNPTAGSQNVGGPTAITAAANTGFQFSSWTCTGSISFADANAASTTATVNGAGSITANFVADTVVATKLTFSSGAPQSLTVNTVSAAIVVQRQDASSNPVSIGTSAITITLTSSGTGTFYSDAAGTTAITSIQIAAGSSSSTGFYYKATVVGTGSHTLTGAFSSLTSSATAFTISAANPVATKLVFSAGATQTLTAGVVSPSAIVVQRQDASNAPVSIGTSAITVALSTGSSGAFSSDAAGTSVITSITIAAGSSSSAGFYYKDTVASTSRTLTGASNGLTSATTNFVINAGAATKLVYTVVDNSVQRNSRSSLFTIQRQDQYNNPTTSGAITVDLSDGTSSGNFYATSSSNNAIDSVQILDGSSTANFYWEYEGNYQSSYQSRTLTASDTGLTSATTIVAVTN